MTDLHESSAAYALHALDRHELAEYETHLVDCPICPGEIAAFTETAAELALLAQAVPPAGLRRRILDAVVALPQLPAVNGRSTAGSGLAGSSSRPRRAVPGSEVADEAEPARVDELAVRRQRRRSRVLSALVAAMLALFVGLGGVVYTLAQERQTQIAAQRLEEELLRAPDAKLLVAPLQAGGRVTFVVSKQLNRAQFIGTDLPDPGANRYQLWTGTGEASDIEGITRDVQLPDRGGRVSAFFTGDVAQADFLAVNLEPAGSTPTEPTSAPIAAEDI